MAREKDCTPAQLALAWLAQGPHIVPIPGTTRPERLDQNGSALTVQLSEDGLRRIYAIAPQGAAAGQRYPEGGMAPVHR